MQLGDTQLGKPAVLYKNTKANIEALSGIVQGAIAYATDTDELGTYDGVSAWTWSAGGGGSGAWGSITGTLASQTDLQSALDGKQAADADLTAIAGLSPANDDILQRKAGAWINRTLAQLITDLGLGSLAFLSSLAHSALSGIGTNTHSQIDTHIGASNPHSGSQPLDTDLTDIAALAPSNDDVLQRKAGAWTNRTLAQLLTDLGLAAIYAPIAKGVTNGDSHDHNGGDGGAIAYGSLSSRPTSETQSNDIYGCASPGGTSAWTGTISGTPSGASVTLTTSTGTKGSMKPSSTSVLAKMRLYNLTRGNSALISDFNTATNVCTLTATAPANWANGDSMTIASQTVSGGGVSWVDLEITSGPTSKTYLFIKTQLNSATVGDAFRIHPFEASHSGSKYETLFALTASQTTNGFGLIKITSNVFSISWTGTPAAIIIREAGYLE